MLYCIYVVYISLPRVGYIGARRRPTTRPLAHKGKEHVRVFCLAVGVYPHPRARSRLQGKSFLAQQHNHHQLQRLLRLLRLLRTKKEKEKEKRKKMRGKERNKKKKEKK